MVKVTTNHSRLRDSRVREIEKARLYFCVPYTYASSLLSEILEQAGVVDKIYL